MPNVTYVTVSVQNKLFYLDEMLTVVLTEGECFPNNLPLDTIQRVQYYVATMLQRIVQDQSVIIEPDNKLDILVRMDDGSIHEVTHEAKFGTPIITARLTSGTFNGLYQGLAVFFGKLTQNSNYHC